MSGLMPAIPPYIRRGEFDLGHCPRACVLASTALELYRFCRMRILVMEDERLLARHIVSVLSRQGHAAVAQYDGAVGLQEALRDHPDLIVLDLNLPGLDGLSVLGRLHEAGSPARVLILTARGEVEHRIRGLKAGADDYLTKPFSMDELVARIDALGRRGTAPSA